MNPSFVLLLIVSVLSLGVLACDSPVVSEEEIAVHGVTITSEAIQVVEGESETLQAAIAPDDATNQNVSWSSHDDSVATIDADGVLTGIREGTATIMVTTDDGGHSDSVEVTPGT